MQPYPDQTEFINGVYRAINEGHRRIAAVAGTGFGKSLCISQICSDAVKAGKKGMIIVHLDVLVGQLAEKLKIFNLPLGFVKSGWAENPEAPIQVCSIQTLSNREWWKDYPADFIIYDEAHITLLSQIGKQIMLETHSDAIAIAFTATPERLSGEQLGDYLTALVAAPTPLELQKMGRLVPLVYLVPETDAVDVSDFEIKGDDYDQEQIKNACDRPELIAASFRDWMTPRETSFGTVDCRGKKTIAFCIDVAHANRVANFFNTYAHQYPHAFNGLKEPAICVSGETPVEERKRIYEAFAKGEYLILTSVNVISIGFDEPTVEVGMLLRPTASVALFHQQVGRVMRVSPSTGKTFGIILDRAGNSTRLTIPEKITHYELPISKEKGSRPAPMKTCPECDKLHYAFTTTCQCGHMWITAKNINDNGMIELPTGIYDSSELRRKFSEQRKIAFLEGLDPFEAERKFSKEFGLSPLDSWYRYSTIKPDLSDEEKKRWIEHYLFYLCEVAAKSSRPQEWILEQLVKEGISA